MDLYSLVLQRGQQNRKRGLQEFEVQEIEYLIKQINQIVDFFANYSLEVIRKFTEFKKEIYFLAKYKDLNEIQNVGKEFLFYLKNKYKTIDEEKWIFILSQVPIVISKCENCINTLKEDYRKFTELISYIQLKCESYLNQMTLIVKIEQSSEQITSTFLKAETNHQIQFHHAFFNNNQFNCIIGHQIKIEQSSFDLPFKTDDEKNKMSQYKIDEIIVWFEQENIRHLDKKLLEQLQEYNPSYSILTCSSNYELDLILDSYFIVNLIISPGSGLEKIPSKHLISRFEMNSIFVYCKQKHFEKQWITNQTPKICCISNNFQTVNSHMKEQLELSRIYPIISMNNLKMLLEINDSSMFFKPSFAVNYLKTLTKEQISQVLQNTINSFHPMAQNTYLNFASHENESSFSTILFNNFSRVDDFVKLYTMEVNPKPFVAFNKILWSLNFQAIDSFAPFIKTLQFCLQTYSDGLDCFEPGFKVYRGVNSNANEFKKQFKEGDVIVMPGFTSTSLDKNKAIEFSHNQILFIVEFDIPSFKSDFYSKRGKDISQVSYFSNEQEILFGCFSCFRILEISHENPIEVRLLFFCPYDPPIKESFFAKLKRILSFFRF